MKGIKLVLILTLFTSCAAMGQMNLNASNFRAGILNYNPAFAGHIQSDAQNLRRGEGFGSAKRSWTGFNDAPTYETFYAHMPVNFERMGVGIGWQNRSAFIQNDASINGSYSYKINLVNGTLGFGLSSSFRKQKLTDENLLIKDPDPNAPAGESRISTIDFGFGLFYESDKLLLGFSALNIGDGEMVLNSTGITDAIRTRTYTGLAGFTLRTGRTGLYTPMVLYTHDEYSDLLTILNRYEINRSLAAGVSYRTNNDLSFQFEFSPSFRDNAFRIGYAYDYNTSTRLGNGSHELFFSYLIAVKPGKNKVNNSNYEPNPEIGK